MKEFTTRKASDGGHWYTQTGELLSAVRGAKGQPVKPTLRHARVMHLAPGVTTIIKAADRPMLTNYIKRQVLYAALTLPRVEGEPEELYIDRILDDAAEHAYRAAERGSELHGKIEHGLLDAMSDDPYVLAVAAELDRVAPGLRGRWRCELPCVSRFGYATKSDLSIDELDCQWVVDIKTKDGDLDALQIFDDHYLQLAATREALQMPDAQCAILFLSRTEPAARLVIANEDDVQQGWRVFKSLLYYYQTKTNYRPNWADDVCKTF